MINHTSEDVKNMHVHYPLQKSEYEAAQITCQ
jgi:hypothetical protein